MNVIIDDKLEERFRRAVFEKRGMKKGNISESLEEALDLWITEQARKRASQK